GRLYYGSWAESLANITGTVTSRVSLTDQAVRDVTVGQVLRRYLLEDSESMLQWGPVSLTLPVLAAATLAAAAITLLLLALRRDTAGLRAVAPTVFTWAVSFLGPVSWLVLSKAHSAVHTHLVPMLWHFAFVPCCLVLWVVLLRQLVRHILRR
ncbi:MAG: hypothetical protein ACI4OI_05445, partial [Gemmiger sp.]